MTKHIAPSNLALTLPTSTDPGIQPGSATQFLTITQVATLVGVSERTVRRWIKHGWLPCLVIGRTRRIPIDGLNQFLEGKTRNCRQSLHYISFIEDTPA